MNWKIKATLQRGCAALPGGGFLYYQMQRHCGGLRRPDYMHKLRVQRDLAARLLRHGAAIQGVEMLEVGTGWIPLAPIGFWLCGAARVRTLDLNRHLSPSLLAGALHWISRNRPLLKDLWDGIAPRALLRERLDVVDSLRCHPLEFLRAARIDYAAPADAGRTGLPPGSIDIHFSANVFEHVPPGVLAQILQEGRRLLRPGGIALHHIDPTDHFSHTDPGITTVNFLRFGAREWQRYGGNAFAYHNRLREPEYRRIFWRAGFDLLECGYCTDERALAALRAGFPLAAEFRNCSPEELCRRTLDYMARPAEAVLSGKLVGESHVLSRAES